MLFPTIDFAIFFALAFGANWLLNPYPYPWKLTMIGFSYFFYAWADWRFIFLLAASTLIAALGGRAVQATTSPAWRRALMIIALSALLGLLGWFKYYGFLAVNFDNVVRGLGGGDPLPLFQVTLPIAISFFTFMAISYVVDIYRRQLEPAPFIDVAFYLSFFPHLIAGPIVRGRELLPQIAAPRRAPSRINFERAVSLIMSGLFKKVVVSSFVASAIVDPVFNSPTQHSGLDALFSAWGYAVQIYCDFSGYTDIAIGCALLLGIVFPINFDSPYRARNLQDFWRRWHITLSRWLRDYLYIPLGGGRGRQSEITRNIMITMILGGLWHGADWTFVIWGALHGAGQVIGHLRRTRRITRGLDAVGGGWWRVARQEFFTFQFVCLGWVFFRATSFANAMAVLSRLAHPFSATTSVTPLLIATIAAVIAMQHVPKNWTDRARAFFAAQWAGVQVVALACGLVVITTLGPQGVAPFIYYRF